MLEADKLGSIHVLDMGCGRKPWVTLQLLGSSSSTSRTRQDLQIVAIDATANNIQQATHYLNDTGEELDNVLTLVMDMQVCREPSAQQISTGLGTLCYCCSGRSSKFLLLLLLLLLLLAESHRAAKWRL